MKLTRPEWVAHKEPSSKDDTNPKRLPIFSVHVHPDGSRIATGGLDAKVRIWSTKPILNPAADASGRPPKVLCTLAMHTGPVLCVRWAHSGRWLASGSDDEIVMIWDLDPHAKGKVWGSDEVNVEGWKPLKRLPGHESDVVDIAWSPADRYLATVGLDSKVIIWDGYTLERVRKLDQHQGFVKGVCWDPVGEFLATQSDDRSVKIWRTTDWEIEAEVRKPFADSPGSTFFRRLSWSPDGAHITASNATNNQGFVFIAAVIARNSWTSEISLVGHENTVEVAAYNPHIFLRNSALPVQTTNICSVVALGADDRSISVWQTKSARPLIVAKEVFERQILDLAWSWDGLTLYAVSSDGTLAAFAFTPAEMDGLAPRSAQEQYLTKFGFVPPPLPDGYSHTDGPRLASTPAPAPAPSPAVPHTNTTMTNGEVVNVLVAKKGNKNRKRPGAGPNVPSARVAENDSPFAAPFSTHRPLHEDAVMDDFHTLDTFPSGGASASARRTEDTSMAIDKKPILVRGRTLGGDRPREAVPPVVRQITASAAGVSADSGAATTGPLFDVPGVMTFVSSPSTDGDETLEARNAENGDVNEVVFVKGKQTLWLDYLPSPVITLVATASFCAVGTLDGGLHVYSTAGRKLFPTLTLDAPTTLLSGSKTALVALTAAGTLHSWNTKKSTAHFTPVSVRSLLASTPSSSTRAQTAPVTISTLAARPNGAPILILSSGAAYTYDPRLLAFAQLASAWHAHGSDAWSARTRSSTPASLVVASIENALAGKDPDPGAVRSEYWNAALTLGHLEGRMHASRLLESSGEFKTALLVYAKRVADEGFRPIAEELVKELFGPIYYRPGTKEEVWAPTLVGHAKRDLLKDVLQVFARSKALGSFAGEWQDLLKKASAQVMDE